MSAYARRATSGCQSASCVGRSVSHQPRIPAKAIKIRTLPREPPNSPRTAAATTQKIAAALRTGAEAGKSKYKAPPAQATRSSPMTNNRQARSDHNARRRKDFVLGLFSSIVAAVDIEVSRHSDELRRWPQKLLMQIF